MWLLLCVVVVVVVIIFLGKERMARPISHCNDSARLSTAKTVINAIFLEAVCHSRGSWPNVGMLQDDLCVVNMDGSWCIFWTSPVVEV